MPMTLTFDLRTRVKANQHAKYRAEKRQTHRQTEVKTLTLGAAVGVGKMTSLHRLLLLFYPKYNF